MVKRKRFNVFINIESEGEGVLVVVESGRHGRILMRLVSDRKHIRLTLFSECVEYLSSLY